MGYDFEIYSCVHIKAESKTYVWPSESDPNRTIKLFNDDVLTKSEDGTYMKHTGIGCFNIIIIPDEDVEPFKKQPQHLRII